MKTRKVIAVVLLSLPMFLFTRCAVIKQTEDQKGREIEGNTSSLSPMSLDQSCRAADTIHSVLISRAEAVFMLGDERYEAEVSIYAPGDSLIYISAVNSGFEIMRGLVESDSIQVIDRLNRVVYRTAVRKKFGYQNPVNFTDLQNLVSKHFLCDDLAHSREISLQKTVFDFDEAYITKKITLSKESNVLESFEFFHDQTKKYFMGERVKEGFRIYTNFLLGDLEIRASGGEYLYNVNVPVKMNINHRRYSKVNL